MPFTLTMPKLSPTMEGGTIVKWHKKEGELVNPGDLLLEVSTDKATVEHQAIDEGYLRKILIQEGKEAEVNQPIAILTTEANESIDNFNLEEKTITKVEEKPKENIQPKEEKSHIVASPLAKKIAKDKKIDLTQIQGSGPRGRIVSKDLESKPKEKISFDIPSGTFEEIPLTPIRKVITQRLQEAKSTIPHFYVEVSVNVENLIQLREQLSRLDKKVSYNDCMIKAAALALKQHPNVNAGFHAGKQTILQFKTIDISVAVSIATGLITPIITHADQKSLVDISTEIRELAKKAKEGKLAPHEFQGGSFTISNLGMYGVTNFSGIINPPQAALLAVSGILDLPIVKKGEVVPGKIMNLTLSADHRVIDGVAAAEYLSTLKTILENPIALLL